MIIMMTELIEYNSFKFRYIFIEYETIICK